MPSSVAVRRRAVVVVRDVVAKHAVVVAEPVGNRVDVELSRIRFVFSAEALTKMMRALYSVTAWVFASITRTPVALPFASS